MSVALDALLSGTLCLQWNEAPTPLDPLGKDLWLKDEGRNLSESWTDRVAAVLVTAARACGLTEIHLPALPELPAVDQNTLAVSLAIYAAKAQLGAKVALGEPNSEADFLRIQASGAQIVSNIDTKIRSSAIIQIDNWIDQAKKIAVGLIRVELEKQWGSNGVQTILWPTHDEIRVRGMLPIPADIGVTAGLPEIKLVKHNENEVTLDCWKRYAQRGWLFAPETASAIAYYEQAAANLGPTVIVNPRSALAASQELAAWTGLRRYPTRMPVGGIITPQ